MNQQFILLAKRIWGEVRTLLKEQQEQVQAIAEYRKTQERSAEREPTALGVKVPKDYPIETSAEEMARIDDTRETITVRGTIFFNNGFEEKPIEQPVCFSYLSWFTKSKSGVIRNGPNRNFVPCDGLKDNLRVIWQQKAEAATKD